MPNSCHDYRFVYANGSGSKQKTSRLKSGDMFKSPNNEVRLKVIVPSCDDEYGLVKVTKAPKGFVLTTESRRRLLCDGCSPDKQSAVGESLTPWRIS
jgi:hypothetical protein